MHLRYLRMSSRVTLRYGKPQLNLALGLGDQITWQLLQLRRKLSFKVSFSIVFASTFRNIRFNVGIDNYAMNWTFRQLELIVDPFQVVPSLTRPIFFSLEAWPQKRNRTSTACQSAHK